MHELSSHYHRLPIRWLNTLLRPLNAMGIAKASLDENELIAAAREQTGLQDFGDDDRFMTPMRLVLAGLNDEARLNPTGRYLARVNMLRILKHRLMANELLRKHPEILEHDLGDPVVIVGPARSGTTRLHRLLAADRGFAHLRSWETVYPVPAPASFAAREQGQPEKDPRIADLQKALRAVLYLSPQMNAVHPLGAEEVEEEVGLIQHSFSSQLFEVMNYLPSFGEWLMQNDQAYAYEYMVTLLKIIGWFRGDPPGKTWVLKTPQHLQDLDALVHVFPGAKLVFPHRDPVKVMGSIASMVWNGIVRDSDDLNPHWIGPLWQDKLARMLRKTMALRETGIAKGQQHDVLYADITADWQTAIEGIYKFLALPLDERALLSMQQWLDQNRQHQHGAHKYALEDFGLASHAVDEQFMFYRQAYNIPCETRNPHLSTASN